MIDIRVLYNGIDAYCNCNGRHCNDCYDLYGVDYCPCDRNYDNELNKLAKLLESYVKSEHPVFEIDEEELVNLIMRAS